MLLKGRLKVIAEKITPCKCLIDIGTDHAYIPIYAVTNGVAQKSIAADVRKGPVKIANNNILSAGLQDKIIAILSDGFEALKRGQHELPDQAVIAGMGGTLITEIISRGMQIAVQCEQMVLQPMNDIEFCRTWLFENGFNITDESLVMDSGKLYVIMVVSANPTNEHSQDKIDILLGPCLKQGKDPLYQEYLNKQINKRVQILNGLKKGKLIDKIKLCEQELDLLVKWRQDNEG